MILKRREISRIEILAKILAGSADVLLMCEEANVGNTVLIVDDSFTLRHALRISFEKESFNVVEAANGFEAFEVMKSFEGRVDFIVADENMPEMTGLEMIDKVRKLENKEKANVRIILLTSDTSVETRRSAFKNGVLAVFYKPVKPDALVKGLLERA